MVGTLLLVPRFIKGSASAWERDRHDVTVTSVPCKRFETVLFSMRFQGHETVSIGNRARVNDALSSLLSFAMVHFEERPCTS